MRIKSLLFLLLLGVIGTNGQLRLFALVIDGMVPGKKSYARFIVPGAG